MSESDSTPESPPLSSAREAMSRLHSLASLLTQLTSRPVLDTESQKRLLDLGRQYEALKDQLKIESVILTANPRQLETVETFESGQYHTIVAVGGNQCLGPDSLIDGPGGKRKVSEINGEHVVYAWNGGLVATVAGKPFIKGREQCYRVTLADGQWLDVTARHRVLCDDGEYHEIGHLQGFVDALLRSTSGKCRPSWPQGVRRSTRTIQGSRCGCRFGCRCGDGLLLRAEDDARCVAPSPVGVQGHSHAATWDGPGIGQECSRRDRDTARHATSGSSLASRHRDAYRPSGIECRTCGTDTKRLSGRIRVGWQSAAESFQESQSSSAVGQWCPAKQASLVSPFSVQAQIISVEPLGVKDIYDFHVPVFNNYVAGGMVNHNSGKSFSCGRMVFAKHLRDKAKPGSVFWCISPTTEKSIAGPQKEIWNALPLWMMEGQSYDEKNGFGNVRPTLIVDPRGRRLVVRFKSAAQFSDDPRSFEAEAISGVWIDESIEEHVYDALLPRLVAKGGFTLISAIPDVVWMHDRFENAKPDSGIKFIKYRMRDNEANLSDGAIDRMRSNMSSEEAAMRIDGDFRFLSGLVYKEFRKDYKPDGHLVRAFPVPRAWPRWRCMDVGMAHPTACLWLAAAPNENLYVYREFYSRASSVQEDARRIIAASEGEEYRRPVIIDPAAYQISKANTKSVAQQFDEAGLPCVRGPRVQQMGEWALVQKIKKRLEDNRLFVFDTCPNLIREFRTWRFKTDKSYRPLDSEKFVDRDNDGLDALKLLVAINPTHSDTGFQVGAGPQWG